MPSWTKENPLPGGHEFAFSLIDPALLHLLPSHLLRGVPPPLPMITSCDFRFVCPMDWNAMADLPDDFVILCRSPRAAQRVMESVARFVEHRLKLIVNRTKSNVCEIKDAVFLGFTIVKNRIKWSEKSKAKFGARIREITKRTRGVSPCQVMEELQTFVRGAINYYSLGMTYAEARELDGWLRRRVRLYYWKQWGHRGADVPALEGETSSNSGSTVRPFTWRVEVEKARGG